ncbi:MAG: haloacid dehalogenase-like hydrolase [Micromonosporaceae bacterium]|nr:haloacid dehalogenase-like hydrolase [Micromonosporaceae bacterium]
MLWDIDQTLITIGGLSRRIYERAFLQVTAQPLRELADMSGRTERAILRETLVLHGLRVDDDGLQVYFDAIADAAEHLRAEIKQAGYALPGAVEAIRALTAAGIAQSVVTGNLKRVSITKLSAFGLAEGIDFEIGGYGDESEDRALLVKQAMRRASHSCGHDVSGDRVVVIGDTVHDIRAARDTGVRSVGVASGRTAAADLADAGATVVLADLTDTTALVDAVLMRKPVRPHQSA